MESFDAGGLELMTGGNYDNLGISTIPLYAKPEALETPVNPLDNIDVFLKSNLDDISHLILNSDFDWLHVQSGMERVGKSDKGLWMAKYLCSKGLKFDWSKDMSHVFFLERDLAEKLLGLPQYSVAIIDEGGEVLFSRNAMKRTQTSVIQTLFAYGAKNIFLIINAPNWRRIDVEIRENRVRSLLVAKSKPREAFVDGAKRFTRERGFYRFYTRKQVLRATKFKEPLKQAMFTGWMPAFSQYYPQEWGFYKARKDSFLREKSKKGLWMRENMGRRLDSVEIDGVERAELEDVMLK